MTDSFARVASASLPLLEAILNRYGVQMRRTGCEIDMLATHRGDKNFGSFKINRATGLWSDFAAGESGRDVISLVAYIDGKTQGEAMRALSEICGVSLDA